MKFLEEIYKLRNKGYNCDSNIAIYEKGKELNLDIEIGDNFNWCITPDCSKEQAIVFNKELLTLFNLMNIEYNKEIEQEMINLQPDDTFELILEDNSGKYKTTIYLAHLDIRNSNCLECWIDFNNLTKI